MIKKISALTLLIAPSMLFAQATTTVTGNNNNVTYNSGNSGTSTVTITGSTNTVTIGSTVGTNGTNGTNGLAGTNGTNGLAGTNGSAGINGTDGTNGTNGLTGANGTNGTNGTNGLTGATGATGQGFNPRGMYQGVASAMAVALIPGGDGIGFAVANYAGQSGYALGLTKSIDSFSFTAATTKDGSNKSGFGVGVKYGF